MAQMRRLELAGYVCQTHGPLLRARTMAAISKTPMNIMMTQNRPQGPLMDQNEQNSLLQTPAHNLAWTIVIIRDKTRRKTPPMTLRFPIARLERRAYFVLPVLRSSMASGVSRLGTIIESSFTSLFLRSKQGDAGRN